MRPRVQKSTSGLSLSLCLTLVSKLDTRTVGQLEWRLTEAPSSHEDELKRVVLTEWLTVTQDVDLSKVSCLLAA